MKSVNAIVRLVAFPAMLCAGNPAAAQATPPPARTAPGLPDSGRITLFQSDGRVLVMMRIGDGELVPMVFDTGSDGHSVDRLLATRHRMRRIGMTIEVDGTTGSRRTLQRVRTPDVTIGGLAVGPIEAVVLDYNRNDAMGIVTTEMFTGSLLWLDLSRGRATLVPRSAPPPAGPPIDYVEGIPSVQVVMPDGSTLPAHFDTGYNGALSLPVAMMDKVPLMAPARVVGQFQSINTRGEVYGGRIRGAIRIGPVTLENPDVTFLGDLTNIGLPVIRQVTLVIDPAANRNWVLPAGSAPPTR